MSFVDFPDDVQLCVLSFLSPSDVSSFASASKRCVSLCRRCESRLWFAMCDRRWGSKTRVPGWGAGKISYRLLYRTLSHWDDLIGFWRRSGGGGDRVPLLVFFEWGPHFVSGSRVSPSRDGTYGVVKSPFLWLSLSPEGQVASFLDPVGRSDASDGSSGGGELVPASVSFVGRTHFVVGEQEDSSGGFRRSSSSKDLAGGGENDDDDDADSDFGSPGSLPDRIVSEVYQHFANRTSPVGERAARRQRRREKERRARRRKWEPQHFVKIVNCSPTPSRPLQGLWKGICDDMNLGFYLIAYDDIGCITCRKVWNSPENNPSLDQLFWISDTSFLESPFPAEEQTLYQTRVHLRPIPDPHCILESLSLERTSAVSRILYLNSSSRFAEGRIWQYEDGTFGFGFLGDNLVIDLKNVSEDGCLLDAVGFPGD